MTLTLDRPLEAYLWRPVVQSDAREDQIAEGDKVVSRWTGRGTHQGELMGIPPAAIGRR
jgi:predicted ester cyclase